MKRLLIFVLIGSAFLQAQQQKRHFVVVTASYNNERWCEKNIDSILGQKYDNFRLIYLDDCSTDKTYEKVSKRIKHWKAESKVTLIRNQKRKGAMANIYHAIGLCSPDSIVAMVDGDDALAHDKVLNFLAMVYEDPKVWVTYGQFRTIPHGDAYGCKEIHPGIFKRNSFRKELVYPHFPSHLKTFYAGLAQQIKKDDMMWEGDFLPATSDLALMFPIIEMARKGHVKFISKILYDYNQINPINDNKVQRKLQYDIDQYLRALPPYEAVDSPY